MKPNILRFPSLVLLKVFGKVFWEVQDVSEGIREWDIRSLVVKTYPF